MNLLMIETSSINCSIAVSINNNIIASVEKTEPNIHAGSITLFIEEALKNAQISLNDIDAIAVGKGPGSYTGLRIGVSTAKGLCYALNIPLIACNSLETLYKQALSIKMLASAIYIPLIDARRMEVYTCAYATDGLLLDPVQAIIIDENTFANRLANNTLIFFGDGAEKVKSLYETHENAQFINSIYPSSKYMLESATAKYEHSEFEDVAYFEPFYLKEFYFNK